MTEHVLIIEEIKDHFTVLKVGENIFIKIKNAKFENPTTFLNKLYYSISQKEIVASDIGINEAIEIANNLNNQYHVIEMF